MNNLKVDGLNGKRIGVFRYYTDQPTTDPEIINIFENALSDLEKNGATLVDPFIISDFEKLTEDIWCNTFKHNLNQVYPSIN